MSVDMFPDPAIEYLIEHAPEEDPEPCAAETRAATYLDPPEFCEEDSLPGSEFCAGHDPDAYDDHLESLAEARREDGLR